jgi:hypothetical protein
MTAAGIIAGTDYHSNVNAAALCWLLGWACTGAADFSADTGSGKAAATAVVVVVVVVVSRCPLAHGCVRPGGVRGRRADRR